MLLQHLCPPVQPDQTSSRCSRLYEAVSATAAQSQLRPHVLSMYTRCKGVHQPEGGVHMAFWCTATPHSVTRRKLQTPGTAEEHNRQEAPTINPIDHQPTHLTDQAPSTIKRAARETHNTTQFIEKSCAHPARGIVTRWSSPGLTSLKQRMWTSAMWRHTEPTRPSAKSGHAARLGSVPRHRSAERAMGTRVVLASSSSSCTHGAREKDNKLQQTWVTARRTRCHFACLCVC